MDHPQNSIKLINSGQLRLQNRTNTINNPKTKLKVLQFIKNQKSNTDLNFCMDIEDGTINKIV